MNRNTIEIRQPDEIKAGDKVKAKDLNGTYTVEKVFPDGWVWLKDGLLVLGAEKEKLEVVK